MKKVLLAVLFCMAASMMVEAAERVSGYYRSNGTYVQPYYRSDSDGNSYNNYSYPGNTNPYTGVTATGNTDTYIRNNKTSFRSYDSNDNDSFYRSNRKSNTVWGYDD